METPKLPYLPQLDGLRALAVTMVFVHHALGAPLLWSGVDLFFILSGYLITSILLRDSERMAFGEMLGKFYLRRAERILPAYLIFLFVIYWFVKPDWNVHWGYYLCFLQNAPNALQDSTPMAPLWSLAVEQHFYLVWPILLFFLPRRSLVPCMLVLLLGEPILRALCTPLFPTSATIYTLTPFRLDALAAGALAALMLPHCKAAPTIRAAQAAMLVGIAAYVLLAYHHPWFNRAANRPTFNALAYSLNILILGGLFVWATLSRGTLLVRVLAHPVLRWVGRVSYCFYLFHLLVLNEVQRFEGRLVAALIAYPLAIGLASCSWIWIEKPILSLSASHRKADK